MTYCINKRNYTNQKRSKSMSMVSIIRQYFCILFLRPFLVRNVILTQVRFSTVTELRTFEIQDSCVLQHWKFYDVVSPFSLFCVNIPCTLSKSKGVRFGARSGQLCGLPRPIHRPGNYQRLLPITHRCHGWGSFVIVFCVVQGARMTRRRPMYDSNHNELTCP